MKKKFSCLPKIICMFALTFMLASCQKSYQKIQSISVEPGNKEAYVRWTYSYGNPSTVMINISPLPADTKEDEYPLLVEKDKKSHRFTNLENGTTYTITVENYNNNNEFVSMKTAEVTPDENADSYIYSKEKPFIIVPKGKNRIKLCNVKNKLITFASLNVGYEEIPGKSVRKFEKVNSARSLYEQTPDIKNRKPRFITPGKLDGYKPYSKKTGNSRSSSSYDKEALDLNNLQTGETKMTLWLDNTKEAFMAGTVLAEYYEEREVTLWGIGKDNGQTVCLVWVDDECYAEKCEGKQVNADLAQNLADIFVDYYLHERDIAGQEINVKGSRTGEAVNLVLYDIAKDFSANEDSVVMGYFDPNDYREVSISNLGKFLYLDTPTCNFSSYVDEEPCYDGNIDENTGKYVPSGYIISTIIHEFQHMIYYGVKDRGNVWYNEMLSMLMEDIMFNDLSENYGLTKADGPMERLSIFNWTYYSCDWTEGDFEYSKYAPTYAFGAWLVRNYGGIQLIQKMYSDDKTGFTSIVNAVNELNGFTGSSKVTRKDLLEQFLAACMINPQTTDVTNLSSFNKTCGEVFESHGHTSKLLPLDLYAEENNWLSQDENGTFHEWRGPLIFTTEANQDLFPTTFIIRTGLGTKDKDEIELSFTEQLNDNEEFFICVQEPFTNVVEEDKQ